MSDVIGKEISENLNKKKQAVVSGQGEVDGYKYCPSCGTSLSLYNEVESGVCWGCNIIVTYDGKIISRKTRIYNPDIDEIF